jgi:hypothetical protein
MRQIKYLLIFLFSLALIGSACEKPDASQLFPDFTPTPSPSPLIIDGIIYPREWSAAERYEIPGGGDLFLLREGEMLYLAVSGSRPGVLGANVYLDRGDQVWILHISAALGTAEYTRQGDSWSLVRDFDWQCRTVGNDQAALQERAAYFDAEGWSAPNARTGVSNQLEMQIQLQPDTRLAISLLVPSAVVPFVWPQGLEDDTGKTFSSGLKPELDLQPESWFLLP